MRSMVLVLSKSLSARLLFWIGKVPKARSLEFRASTSGRINCGVTLLSEFVQVNKFVMHGPTVSVSVHW